MIYKFDLVQGRTAKCIQIAPRSLGCTVLCIGEGSLPRAEQGPVGLRGNQFVMSMPPPRSTLGVPQAAQRAAPRNSLAPPATAESIRGGGGGTRAGARAKVVLKPGRSPLDWANLRSSGKDLRGVPTPQLLRISKEELATHKTKEDCWMALRGRVYNVTAYVEFHPGGEKELLRGAGRDATRLFELTHAWVNFEHMLDKCLVGFLV